MKYWFNVKTGQVEEDAVKSRENDIMGPYDSREDAEHALTHAQENTQQWDDEDRAWNDEGLED